MRTHAARAALVVLALVAVILVGPGMHASGSLEEIGPLELGSGATPAGVAKRGQVQENVDGYQVAPGGEAVVSMTLTLPQPDEGRTMLRVWAYGPEGVRTTAVLRAADGSERALGRAHTWGGRLFDVTEEARSGNVQLRVRGENSTDQRVLFLDRVVPVLATGGLQLTASPLSVGLLVLLITAAMLALAGRMRRHWSLPILLAAIGAVLWREIKPLTLEPLVGAGAATWASATEASWFGFTDGLLSGSWPGVSSLAVQVFHALTPLVGSAPVSARAAAVLTSLLALAAVYGFGYRAAGSVGAGAAVLLAALAPGFNDAAIAGSPLPVLVLAGAVFGYALHACLAEATPMAIAILGAGVALLLLAEPTWLPGALLALIIVAITCADSLQRWRIVRVGLLAAFVCALPHLVSTASQNDGRMFASLQDRAVAARNIEFLGRGHGAPTPQQFARDPRSGRPVTLTGYLFSDHSPTQFIGGALTGARESISAFTRTDRSGALGTVAVMLLIAGAAFVLLLERLRLLMLLAPLVAAPALFIAAQTQMEPAAAGAVLWTVMLVCAAILIHAATRVATSAVEPYLLRLREMGVRVLASLPPGGALAALGRRRT